MRQLEDAEVLSAHDRGLLAEIKEAIRRFLPAAEVYLYGSVARGTHNAESDYDLLVVTAEPPATTAEEMIWDAVFDIEIARGVPISVQFCGKAEWQQHQNMPFYVEVRRDGIAL